MIKINGLNYKKGDGDSYTFGNPCNRNGDGTGDGKGIDSWDLSYSLGSVFGDGYFFGYRLGDGGSYSTISLKIEYQNND